uniref:RRM domain-containing protein n=1 Tax=Rhodosorus marinus TaxID=101924 RepID=A0A7S2ZD33_9RHOD
MLVSRAGFVFGRLVAGAEKSAMTRAASQKMWMATAESKKKKADPVEELEEEEKVVEAAAAEPEPVSAAPEEEPLAAQGGEDSFDFGERPSGGMGSQSLFDDPAGAPRRRRVDTDEETRRKVFVGNLAWGTDENSLSRGFAHLGSILDAHVVRSAHDQRSRGFGFITFETEDSAGRAIREMEGAFLDGRDIRVQPARKREPREFNRPQGGFNREPQGGYNRDPY